MEFNEVLNKRRSVRKFLSKKVERNLLLELIKSATQAPDACNLQLTQYVILDDAETLEKLCAAAGEKFSLAPCHILVLCDSRFGAARNAASVSAGMAVENMSLRAVDLGLGTCAMAGFGNDAAIRDILSIPKHLNILLLLAVGYPDASAHKEPIPKLAIDEISSFNGYGGLPSLNESMDLNKNSVRDVINYRRRIAPVYLDRFKLNTLNNLFYEKSADFFIENALPGNGEARVLDLMSYDGVFLKYLAEKTAGKKLEITASDYLEGNLSFLKKKLGVKTALIGGLNELSGARDNSFDAVSFVFQADFTPELDCLIRQAYAKLKSGGYFFAAVADDIFYKKIAKKFVSLFKTVVLRERLNVYEGNPFFKEGPFAKIKAPDLAARLKRAGFVSVDTWSVFYGEKGAIIRYCLARK